MLVVEWRGRSTHRSIVVACYQPCFINMINESKIYYGANVVKTKKEIEKQNKRERDTNINIKHKRMKNTSSVFIPNFH